MTKVSIIEVELTETVPQIITDEICNLTAQNQQQLDTARAATELTQQLSEARRSAKSTADSAMGELLADIYRRLQEAGDNGLPAPVIMDLVQGQIGTASAFSTRMKTYLRGLGNPHVMVRQQIRQQPCYLLRPYNLEPEPEA